MTKNTVRRPAFVFTKDEQAWGNGNGAARRPDRRRGEECKHIRGLREEHGFSAGIPAADRAIPIPSSVSELSLPRFLIIDIPGGVP